MVGSHRVRFGLAVSLPLFCAACGAGGSSPPNISFEFVSGATSTAGENGGTATIDVRLNLLIDELAEEATVEIYDSGRGSAAPGVDYAPFATQTLVFPAGSTDGATQSLDLTSIGDSVFEGTETVSLQLSNPSGGSGLGVTNTITVEIGDEQAAMLSFGAASGITPESGTFDIPIVLGLDPGVVLEEDLSVGLIDTLTGTALAGADFGSLAASKVTFLAGSSDGETQNFEIAIVEDVAMEGDETLIVELEEEEFGSTMAAPSTYTLTITDDDSSGDAFLLVTQQGVGTLNTGETVDLGSQTVGAGPNTGVQLTITNAGGQALDFSAPNVTGTDANDFSVEVSLSSFAPAATAGPTMLATPLVPTFTHPIQGTELALDPVILQAFEGKNEVTLVAFPLPDGSTCDLELTRVKSPWAQNAVLFVDGAPLPGGHTQLVGDLTTWKGKIAGDSDSSAFLSFSQHGCRGWIRFSEAPEDLVHLVTDLEDTGDATIATPRLVHPQQMIAAGANQSSPQAVCGGALIPPGQEDPVFLAPGAQTAGLSIADCRVAVETDYQFFQEFGDAAAATAYATQLFAAVSDVYLRDIQTTLSIAYLGIHTDSNDGWTTPDGPGTTSAMLTEFRDAWAGSWPVAADLAHFLSGASMGGGIAYVNVLCNQNFGFGVSGSLNANIDWGTWTGQSSFLNWDFVVVAHEIGHNFSAGHTHSYCPPIDQCSSDNCNSTQTCQRGTIMSYCHTCSGGLNNIDIEFHPFIANVMRTAVNSSCLGQSELASGESVQYQLRFRPTSSAGAKTATMSLSHNAPNVPSAYQLTLTGNATN